MLDCAGDYTKADDLAARFGTLPAADLLRAMIEEFPGRLALVSSFGAEAAVLLHMVAKIDRALPVIFLDTGKLFAETLMYRDLLINRIGLANVQTIRPRPDQLAKHDPDGALSATNPDLCCAIRKTMPLDAALKGRDAWISGRKRAQGGMRLSIRPIETGPDGRVVINPLWDWSRADLDAYFERHRLPRHKLEEQGYASIGCAPCTAKATTRAGRWTNTAKTECGIHLPRHARGLGG